MRFMRDELIGTPRDTEDSAPAVYPPDQPEADLLDDDGATYGAEEEDDEEEEAGQAVEGAEVPTPAGEDAEMAGAEDTSGPAGVAPVKEEDEASDAGSEDLEAESTGDDEEDLEEEEGEGDGDEDMEMGDASAEGNATKPAQKGETVQQPESKRAVEVH